MSRSLALFAIGLVFGGGAGFVIAADNGVTFGAQGPGAPAQYGEVSKETKTHDHSTPVDIAPGSDAPSVSIEAFKDAMSGWNLKVTPVNFSFAPQNASSADVPGEGHAHIYINGDKLGRLYGKWYHLTNLPKGEVEIKVSLNGNSHSPLMVNSVPVEATTVIQTE